jgi:hypothetical protein
MLTFYIKETGSDKFVEMNEGLTKVISYHSNKEFASLFYVDNEYQIVKLIEKISKLEGFGTFVKVLKDD